MAVRLGVVAGFACSIACSAPTKRVERVTPPTPVDPTAPTLPPGVAPPKLVVLLIVDQLPQWSFAQKRVAFERGLARLLREGEWHTGQHPSAATLTGPGHAVLGTGAATWRSGIVGNEWWDRASGKVVRAAETVDGTISAGWLRVAGLGDAVAANPTSNAGKAGNAGKAVSVALKDRAAVLPLGHAGTAIYYKGDLGTWHSTVDAPWLAAHDKHHPVSARLQETWTPSDPQKLAQLSGTVDDAPGEVGEKGFGKTFPHAHAATKQPTDAIFATPLGNELTLAMARAAIEGEGLGTDATPDLLVVSLSAHDYVGHGWGHESWEAWDMLLRLDGQLERFFAALDNRVGADGWAMVFTSDHGASPQPRANGGGAITYDSIKDAANRAASLAFGAGDWIAYAKYPTVYLNAAAKAKPPKDVARALLKIVYALRSYPGLDVVELTSDVAGDCGKRTGNMQLYCMALDVERSGEVFFHPRRHWIFEDRSGRFATAHGSIHPFDREVPLVLLPPGRKAKQAAAAPSATVVPIARVAPLLAGWLGVPAPSTLEGSDAP